jgi:hypothetical protein
MNLKLLFVIDMKMNKDKIEKCKKCEFRYACPVCLPAIINGDPCTYDPEVGRWL